MRFPIRHLGRERRAGIDGPVYSIELVRGPGPTPAHGRVEHVGLVATIRQASTLWRNLRPPRVVAWGGHHERDLQVGSERDLLRAAIMRQGQRLLVLPPAYHRLGMTVKTASANLQRSLQALDRASRRRSSRKDSRDEC